MKDCTKSKIDRFIGYINGGVVLFFSLVFIVFIIRKVTNNDFTGKNSEIIALLFIFGVILLGYCVILKPLRYIIIKDKKLTYYSIFCLFGRTLDLNNYKGKIITTETGSGGEYKVVYLVDNKNITSFKITGVFYKNMDEINDAIPLKKICFSPTVGQYFKLLFTGKIKVENRNKKEVKYPIRLILIILAAIPSIGIALFVIGMIVKIIYKLL